MRTRGRRRHEWARGTKLAATILGCASLAIAVAIALAAPPATDGTRLVECVVDGDTLVLDGGELERVERPYPHRLEIELSEADLEDLEAAAERAGLTTAEWVLAIAVREAQRDAARTELGPNALIARD